MADPIDDNTAEEDVDLASEVLELFESNNSSEREIIQCLAILTQAAFKKAIADDPNRAQQLREVAEVLLMATEGGRVM